MPGAALAMQWWQAGGQRTVQPPSYVTSARVVYECVLTLTSGVYPSVRACAIKICAGEDHWLVAIFRCDQ